MKESLFSKELIEIFKQNAFMSPSTWHKIMNPLCGPCLAERGRQIINQKKRKPDPGAKPALIRSSFRRNHGFERQVSNHRRDAQE